MDHSHEAPLSMGILQVRILEWVAMPSTKDLPNPEIELRSPALQADSLPSEPPGKLKNIGVGSLSLLQGIFLTQGSNQSLLHCGWILYQLSDQGSLNQKKEFCFQPDLFSVWNNWKKEGGVGWGGGNKGRKNKSKKNRQSIYKKQVSVFKMLEMRHWNSVIPETENKSCPALWPPSFCPENSRLGHREAESGRFPE